MMYGWQWYVVLVAKPLEPCQQHTKNIYTIAVKDLLLIKDALLHHQNGYLFRKLREYHDNYHIEHYLEQPLNLFGIITRRISLNIPKHILDQTLPVYCTW